MVGRYLVTTMKVVPCGTDGAGVMASIFLASVGYTITMVLPLFHLFRFFSIFEIKVLSCRGKLLSVVKLVIEYVLGYILELNSSSVSTL